MNHLFFRKFRRISAWNIAWIYAFILFSGFHHLLIMYIQQICNVFFQSHRCPFRLGSTHLDRVHQECKASFTMDLLNPGQGIIDGQNPSVKNCIPVILNTHDRPHLGECVIIWMVRVNRKFKRTGFIKFARDDRIR